MGALHDLTGLGFPGLELPDLRLRAGSDILEAAEHVVDEDPCSGTSFAEIPVATAQQVNQIVDTSRRAFESPTWRSMLPLARERLLYRFADLIEADLPRLAALEALDTGRSLAITETVDVPVTVAWLRTYAGWPTKLAGKAGPLAATPGHFHAYTRREPIGVVAAIVPWNFPMVLAMWKIAPALAAGCTVVLKPAPETPLSALRLVELAAEAGLPAGVFQVVTGGADAGAALVDHPRVAKVAFTGSTATGQAILRASANNLTRVTLELGGKSPTIICADADLDNAIAQAAASCFFNAGQVCYAGTRLYVHNSVHDQVIEGLGRAAASHPLGRSSERVGHMGPLISARQHDRVSGLVDRAKAAGIEALPTGEVPKGGYYYAPTVLRSVPHDAEIARDEVFGPVLATAGFDDLDEAIARANGSDFGLAAHVFTRDLSTAHRAAAELEAGTVFVNCVLAADPGFPFGGRKKSGIGRENGEDVLDAYLEPKSVIVAL